MSDLPNTTEPTADREVVITREYDAPASLLFKAWSQAEHLLNWFGPKPWPLTMCEVDFRVGGRYRMAMTGPDGIQNTPFGGEYLEIEPDRKIVFDDAFEEPGAERMIMTITLNEHEGRTTLTVRTLFSTAAVKDSYVDLGFLEGYSLSLEQLDDVVKELKGGASS